MVQTRLFLEQDPPTQAIHAGVVGFIVLVFIVARVLTTRGFAALRPGFNTRAIVTWLACTSLTLMVFYSCLIARTLYNESMAGYYPGPPVSANYEPPSNITPFQFPVSVSFQDMSGNSEWDLSNITPPPQMDFNYVLAMKPISLYSLANRHFLFALRIVLKVSQSGLMACLLLLNTYWCSHVEALVDEGNFMSKTEMYMYWMLAALVIIFPVTVFVGIGYGTNNWQTASRASDLLLLLLGLTIILGYIMTCLRLRALERDSRDVNGDDTPTTLQLTYYVYCIYWLIGSMFAILVLGILYEFTLVSPAECPVLAQVVNDIQGALWSTLVILVYPAAMFLLYPSVDVLTKPENDPAARFQKRVRRTVKDATRIRESFYLESDSANGIETGHHSSLYGLTSNSGVSLRPSDSGQPQQNQQQQQQQQQQQRQSIYEPKRRERMGSITAAVNEMQLIVEEEGAGPLEVIRDVDDKSVFNSPMYDTSTTSASNFETERSSKDETVKSTEVLDSLSPNDGERDAVAVKSWLVQNEHLNGARALSGKDKDALFGQQGMDESHSATSALTNVAFPAAYDIISSTSEEFAMKPIHDKPKSSAATIKSANMTPSKSAATPLTGILKTRASTSSGRSSVGQNPSEPTDHGGSDVPSMPTRSAPAYGVRTSSAQASQHMHAGSRKSSENVPVRRRTSSGSSRHNLATSSSAPNLLAIPSAQSPSSQQRRSNVTGRVDASALALAAQQNHQYPQNLSHRQQEQKPRTSSDGVEIDYFGLRKFSFENHPNATPTSPPPLPYEPQVQGTQQVELVMSPTMTGFLMADPYPSAGTRHFDSSDSEQGPASTITQSDSQEDLGGSETNHRRSGSASSSKKYKAPPPPIPTDLANIGVDVNRDVGNGMMPTTPMTPTTPPGVRPGRSLDTVVDRQFIEMANQMYDDHIVPPHVLQNIASAGSMYHRASVSPSLTTRLHQPLPSSLPPAPQTPTPPAPVFRNDTPQATTAGQQQQELDSPSQCGVSPPTKSPHRARESFESRMAQTGPPNASSGQNVTGGPGPSTPPSPVSTVSPTIASAATLPRPLTPAWYETKTNFASTNDVLSHYNAVMRGGNHQLQQQQELQNQYQYHPAGQGIANEEYHQQNAIGPLDKVSMTQRPSVTQHLPPIHPMQMLTIHPQQHPAARPQQLNQHQNQGQMSRQDYAQPRMGSADSFGVIRNPSSQRKEDASRSSLQNMHPNEQQQQRTQQQQQQQQQLPDIDRHSFMMPSESISAYSTWTGDLSDVTNTSGEVSVGAFLDRKQASTTHFQRRKSAEKPTSSSLSASTNSGGHSSQGQPRSDERGNTQDVRKSQTSAYSMGSSFGAGSSSRQSGGAYSNYSNNSGFGSGPVVVSASLSSDGHSSGANNTISDTGGAGTITACLPSRRHSGPHKRRTSGGGHGTTVRGTMDDASEYETTDSRPNTMRLSAFGADDHGHHAPLVDHRAGDQSRETSTTDKAFYLDDVDAQTSHERERRIQQEWMDRRAAVKKDSRNRLGQLHRQQQELEEHERHLLEQLHQLRTEEGQRPQELEEPYRLNSVYFKSSAELLNQLGLHPPSPPSMAQASSSQEYPSSKTESVSLSAESPAPAISLCESSTITTAITASSSPFQHPAVALASASTPAFNATSRPYNVASAQPSSYNQRQESERSCNSPRDNNDSAEDANSLIQSSSSYAQHHQIQSLRQRSSPMQEQQPMNPSLLHYDSLDSIATVRAVHQPHPYSTSSPPLSRSALSSPTSSSPSMHRPLYSPYQHQQQQQSQQFNGHPTQSSQYPSSMQGYPQYRIATPEDRERASPIGGSVGSDTNEYRGNTVASRTMSPVQRTSSRLTNVTNAESEYQWESAELNHHHWEMMETPPKSQ